MTALTLHLDYQPTRKQQLFHRSTADEVLYGGAAGGGKSRAVVMEALLRALETPGIHAYLFRRTYAELRDTLIREALCGIPAQLGTFKGSSYDFCLLNGSVLHFRHCQHDDDRIRYQGAEIHYLFIDELTHFPRSVYEFLKTRLRAATALGIRPMVRATANPGGIGHGWVKRYFIDGATPYALRQRVVHSEVLKIDQTRTVQYIPALPTDNPHLSPDYIIELEQKPDALKKALLFGNWDAFEGQVFLEWKDDPRHYADGLFTHVVTPFRIPAHWRRYRCLDWGYAKPYAVLWFAVDEHGYVYLYRELYGCSGVPDEGVYQAPIDVAQKIVEVERAHGEWGSVLPGASDPAIFTSQTGDSIASQLERAGVYFRAGDNARIAGKMTVHRFLRLDEKGRPGLRVFSCCKHTLRTLPTLVYSTAQVEDVNTAGEDHIYDCLRYFLMSRPMPSAPPKIFVPGGLDPLDTRSG